MNYKLFKHVPLNRKQLAKIADDQLELRAVVRWQFSELLEWGIERLNDEADDRIVGYPGYFLSDIAYRVVGGGHSRAEHDWGYVLVEVSALVVHV